LKRLQSSEPLHTKIIQPSACSDGLYRNLYLAGALLFDEKIHQNVALFWFGLRDARVSSNIFHKP
jgi:hypothetical protein